MTNREKIFLTIIAALIFSVFEGPRSGCSQPDHAALTPRLNGKDTTLEYLQKSYAVFNETYFDNKLPKDTVITLDESDPNFMGSTVCAENNLGCILRFNPHYIASPRYADLTILHEMCHIPTWDEHVPGKNGQDALHGPLWRTCMLTLDMQGAFRYELIDGYDGNRGIVTGEFK